MLEIIFSRYGCSLLQPTCRIHSGFSSQNWAFHRVQYTTCNKVRHRNKPGILHLKNFRYWFSGWQLLGHRLLRQGRIHQRGQQTAVDQKMRLGGVAQHMQARVLPGQGHAGENRSCSERADRKAGSADLPVRRFTGCAGAAQKTGF